MNTILYYDYLVNEVRHDFIDSIADKSTIVTVSDPFTLNIKAPPAGLIAERLARGQFTVENESSSCFSLKLDHWLCALPRGRLVADRRKILAWEKFSIAPIVSVDLPVPGYPAMPRTVWSNAPQAIPRLIHQIYLDHPGNNAPPQRILSHIERTAKRNEDYHHHLWQLEEIVDSIRHWYGSKILYDFLRINPRYAAARADLFRYLLIYKMGGIYFDLHSSLSKPLSEIIQTDDSYLLSQWDQSTRKGYGLHRELDSIEGGEYQQTFIASAPGHPYLKATIEAVLHNLHRYNRHDFGVGKPGVLRTTGPIPYTLAIHQILDNYSHRFIKSESNGFVFYANPGINTRPHYSELTDDIVM